MLEGKRIAVVVPARDEGARVGAVCRTMPAFVDHIVVVDDASGDATAARAREADPRVEVVRHARNRGVGAALVTGYQCALARGADVVAVMAGDGQMAPAELERVVRPVVTGAADYVKGERLTHREVRRRVPAVRYWGLRALAPLARLATGVAVTDSQCGYTAASRAALEAIELAALWPRYGYPNDLLARLALAGQRIVEVPVSPLYHGGKSGLRPRHFAVMLGLILRGALRRVDRALGGGRPPA
ncbi:MAG: glycosyltransferase family 2 protein [Myxococcales bacterium]|nr:glycosyltransferase family 2 protein [Myxococcales bacterium]